MAFEFGLSESIDCPAACCKTSDVVRAGGCNNLAKDFVREIEEVRHGKLVPGRCRIGRLESLV